MKWEIISGKDISNEDAKNSFRRIFSLLNFNPAFNTIDIRLRHGEEFIKLKAETIASTQPEIGEPFRIIYLTTPKLTKTLRRAIVKELVDWDEKYANFIAIIRSGENWEIVSPVYFSKTDRLEIRVYVAGEGHSHRTLSLALAQIKLENANTPSVEVRERVNEAFKVKALTEEFFKDYKRYYDFLKKTVLSLYQSDIEKHYKEDYGLPKEIFVERTAKTFTHSFLNRLMFIYFLQKKGWIGGIKDFVVWLWNKYEETLERDENNRPVFKNEFYSHYLRPLFFDALNKPRDEKVGLFSHLPDEVVNVFENVPFFNGGLFEKAKEGDVVVDDIVVKLPDQVIFDLIFRFLEEYNFTVSEKTPLDVEIAVDPAMLGHIYESLIAQEEGARQSSGIFYTPEAEVHFMVRIALLEYLLTKLYERHGNEENEDEFRERLKQSLIRFIWGNLEEVPRPPYEEDIIDLITRVKIVDPTCGSGAFLVAAYTILRELYRKLGLETTYEGKKRIIRENIYGVDIKSWATRVAELRLWLALIEDEEELPERPVEKLPDGKIKELPILPNLKANVKTADSLVMKEIQINGKNLVLPRTIADRFRSEIGKISERYRQRIERIFDGAVENPERELEEVKREIFGEFIEVMYEKGRSAQATLDGEVIHEFSEEERKLIRELYEAYSNGGNISIPFIWQIDFARVFAEGGFDVVVSNPPYVRQEKIYPEFYDLNEFEMLSSAEQNKLKKWYKRVVQESAKEAVRSIYEEKFELPGRSDLYAYFFVYSTTLLKPHGVLVYITSNSWLDVEFGVKLQEFFLRYGKLRYVFDSLYRSFEEADINTVITVFERKDVDEASVLDNHHINFVLLKKTFEELTTDDIVEVVSVYPLHVDRAGDIKHYELFGAKLHFYEGEVARIRYIAEKELAKLGKAAFNGKSLGGYEGEKLGGLLIRAPEIFYKIIYRNKDILQKMNDAKNVANVSRGLRTGANSFFYITEDKVTEYKIEREYIIPLIKSSRDLNHYKIRSADTGIYVLNVEEDIDSLKSKNKSNVLKYIMEGELKGFHKKNIPSKGGLWYNLGLSNVKHGIIIPEALDVRFMAILNENCALADQRFTIVNPHEDSLSKPLCAYLNSTFYILLLEMLGRRNLGEGALDIPSEVIKNTLVLNLDVLNKLKKALSNNFDRMSCRSVKTIFEELGLPKPNDDLSNINPEDVKLENIMPDRRELDKIIFEALGLSEEEQLEVYRAVVELVKWRLSKAKSV